MKFIDETVLEFGGSRDDLRTINLEYDYSIESETQLASILLDLDYDFGDITTSETVQVFYKGYTEKYYTNGFDLICAFKAIEGVA